MAKQKKSSLAIPPPQPKDRRASGDLVFGTNLRKERKRRELTLEQLATMIGQTKGAISHFETGATAPSLDTLRKLGEALETGVDALLYGRGHRFQRKPPQDKATEEHIAKLPEAVRDFASAYLESTEPGTRRRKSEN